MIPLLAAVLITVGVACRDRAHTSGSRSRYEHIVENLYKKDSVTILLTDSGLGGLSVTASLERLLEKYHPFRSVRLVFANALPERDYIYNRMGSTEEKARVFNAALEGMNRAFHPDVILIACNTLSVVYPHTEFASLGEVPVIGIVEFGVDAMLDEARKDSAASVIILGTPTTIDQNSHAAGLIAGGVDPKRITTQACDMLETEIQADPSSDVVASMIDMYATEALARDTVAPPGPLVVGLCCSHYGFARDLFRAVFDSATDRPVTIVDPNLKMSEFMVPAACRGRFDSTNVTVSLVSRAEITDDEKTSISAAVRPVSALTADAVVNYTLDTNLFSF
jgi:glutamate racemase